METHELLFAHLICILINIFPCKYILTGGGQPSIIIRDNEKLFSHINLHLTDE